MERDIFSELKTKGLKGQKGALFAIIILVVVIVVIALNPFITIGAGERGVIMNFGAVQKQVLGE